MEDWESSNQHCNVLFGFEKAVQKIKHIQRQLFKVGLRKGLNNPRS